MDIYYYPEVRRMRIGDVIRTEREKKGMTQAVLAEKVHVTVQAVSGWENGKSIPDIIISTA